MKQPPENNAGHAQGMRTPPAHGAATWASAQLRDQIQRSAAAPETGYPDSKQVHEAHGRPPADLEAEPARTVPDHANQSSTGRQITDTGGRAGAAAPHADQHAHAARSVDCECQAQAGAPCGPAGDHLARYLRATQAGALNRDSLAQVIAGLDVIAPRTLIQPPGERAAAIEAGKTTGQAVHRQRARPNEHHDSAGAALLPGVQRRTGRRAGAEVSPRAGQRHRDQPAAGRPGRLPPPRPTTAARGR